MDGGEQEQEEEEEAEEEGGGRRQREIFGSKKKKKKKGKTVNCSLQGIILKFLIYNSPPLPPSSLRPCWRIRGALKSH